MLRLPLRIQNIIREWWLIIRLWPNFSIPSGKANIQGSFPESSVNFLAYDQTALAAIIGRKSGCEADKIGRAGVRLAEPALIHSPLIAEANVALECRLVRSRPYSDRNLFVGQEVAVQFESGCFNQEGVLKVSRIRPLCYPCSDCYITVDPATFRRVLPDE